MPISTRVWSTMMRRRRRSRRSYPRPCLCGAVGVMWIIIATALTNMPTGAAVQEVQEAGANTSLKSAGFWVVVAGVAFLAAKGWNPRGEVPSCRKSGAKGMAILLLVLACVTYCEATTNMSLLRSEEGRVRIGRESSWSRLSQMLVGKMKLYGQHDPMRHDVFKSAESITLEFVATLEDFCCNGQNHCRKSVINDENASMHPTPPPQPKPTATPSPNLTPASTPQLMIEPTFPCKQNPSRCLGPWSSLNEVPKAWQVYLEYVYGTNGVEYPFDPSTLTFFYADRVPFRHHVRSIVPHQQMLSTSFGHLFECGWKDEPHLFWCTHNWGTGYSYVPAKIRPKDVSTYQITLNTSTLQAAHDRFGTPGPSYGIWSFSGSPGGQHKLVSAFQNHQRVEVHHMCCDDFVEAEGMWFFFAPGSGVYLDLGTTMNFRDKIHLCNWFNDQQGKMNLELFDCSICCGPFHRHFVPIIRGHGIDTIVFTDSVPGGYVSIVEIWDLRESKGQTDVCPPIHEDSQTCEDCTARFLFRGFNGTEPCMCDHNNTRSLRCIEATTSPTTTGSQQINKLAVVLTGDVHGYVDSVPALTELLRKRRNEGATLAFSAGDAFVGSRFFEQNGPVGIGSVYQPLRYDAMGLGNHDLEFHFALMAFASAAGSPVVCFNIRNLLGVVPWVRLLALPTYPSLCATGFTVLDHGIVNETAIKYTVPGSSSFWTMLHTVLDEMREAGCQLTFIIGHGGLKLDREIANQTPASVVVLGGHDHDVVMDSAVDHVVMHAGAEGHLAGVLELEISTTRLGVTKVVHANASMVTLINATSVQRSNEPVLFELLWTQGNLPLQSRACRCGPCALGHVISELMFMATACENQSPAGVAIGALREAGSIRAALNSETTEDGLREVLRWNNDLIVVELRGQDITAMVRRSNESITQDGGGAALSMYGVRQSTDGSIEVLAEEAVRVRCQRWKEGNRVLGPRVEEVSMSRFRRLGSNETALFAVTKWLWQGGDGFMIMDSPIINSVGPEVEAIINILTKGTGGQVEFSSGKGEPSETPPVDDALLGAALGAIGSMITTAVVYGCSRTQTRSIIHHSIDDGRQLSLGITHILPCTNHAGLSITIAAVGIGHFLFWSTIRCANAAGMHNVSLVSFVAAIALTFLENPLWVIVTRVQASDDYLISDYRRARLSAARIWNESGFSGFYAGLQMNMLLTTYPILKANLYYFFAGAFAVYVSGDVALAQLDQKALLRDVPWISTIAGVFATGIATLVTYPLQVIRSALPIVVPVELDAVGPCCNLGSILLTRRSGRALRSISIQNDEPLPLRARFSPHRTRGKVCLQREHAQKRGTPILSEK